jgi:hypothetical protein
VIPAIHVAAAVLDHDEHVEPVQEDGIDVGEVDREDRVGLRGGTAARSVPIAAGPGRCPRSSRRPDDGRGNVAAESGEFAVERR